MKEITIYGRGGQGAVTAAELLAIAAFYDGKKSQAFPSFGVERRGAPVEAFVRFDDKPIIIRTGIEKPDYVIVLDASLINSLDVTKGMKKGGIVIINTKKERKLNGFKTYCTDASSTAIEIFKRDIVNTAMAAAFSFFTKEVSKESITKAVEEVFEGNKELIEKNNLAINRIWEKLDGKGK